MPKKQTLVISSARGLKFDGEILNLKLKPDAKMG